MNFVLDSSLTLAFVFKDEVTQDTEKILDSLGRGSKAFTPALWRWEVGNALLMGEKRKRLTATESNRHLTLLHALPIEIDEAGPREAWNAAPVLARKHQLTLYDAAYLELALRRGLALGSLDTDLRKAAKVEKVPILPEKI